MSKKNQNIEAIVVEKKVKSIFEKIYLIFFLGLPFIFSKTIIDPVLLPRQIFASIFVLIIGLIIIYQISIKKLVSDFTFLKSKVFIAISIFLISIITSFYKATLVSESIYVLTKNSIEVLFLILTTFLILQKQLRISQLIKYIVLYGLIVIAFALFQVVEIIGFDDSFLTHIVYLKSTNANKNLLSSILFLVLPFIVYELFKNKEKRKLLILFVVVISLLLIVVQTKAVLIAVGLFSIISLGLFVVFQSQGFKRRKIKVAIIATMAVLVLFTLFLINNKDKFNHLFTTNTLHIRFLLWKNTDLMIHDNLFLGVGAGNWQINFPNYGLQKFNELDVETGMLTYQRPHNDFLWIFSEMGLFGIISYSAIFLILLYYLMKLIRKASDKSNVTLWILLFGAIIGYCFISFFDFPFERIEHQLLLYIIFSITIAEFYTHFNNQSKKIVVPSLLLFFTILLTSIFSIIVASNRAKGEFHTTIISQALKNNDFNTMISEVDEINNIYCRIDPMSVPLLWYKGVGLFSLNRIKEAQNVFEQALKYTPYNIHVLNNLGSCYEKSGDHKKGEIFYNKALTISPHFEESILNLSAVYYNQKQYERAFKTIDKCLISSTDVKYSTFLSAILIEKINLLILKSKNQAVINKLSDLKLNSSQVSSYYFESKIQNVSFEVYLNGL